MTKFDMRYIPHTDKEIKEMTSTIGVANVGDLFKVIPEEHRLKRPLNLPAAMSEASLVHHLKSMGRNNETVDSYDSFLGGGAYHHYIPVAVSSLTSRGEFLTAYTPYQPEIAQGTLQYLFEFQTMVASLTGMEVSNASQYDGASSVAEAILMSLRVTKKKKVFIAASLHPEYQQVIQTYLGSVDCELHWVPVTTSGRIDVQKLKSMLDTQTAALCVQSPNFYGVIEDQAALSALAHERQALYISCFTEAISLGLLAAPGSLGADIVAGEGASFGNFLSCGGPFLGLFSSQKKFLRQMPGRLVGETVDTQGRRGFVLTLSTREQHIRREKATSNICTNQGLCALAATIYLSLVGPKGLKEIAQINYNHAHYLHQELLKLPGVKEKFSGPFFNEFVIDLGRPVAPVLSALMDDAFFGGIDLSHFDRSLGNCLLVCATEMNTKDQMDRLVSRLRIVLEQE